MRLRGVRLLSLTPPPAGSSPHGVVDIIIDGGIIQAISPASAWRGGWAMPGLWDHHVHMEQWARTARRLDLSAATTPADVLDLVRRAAHSHNPATHGATLIGVGLWHSRWPHPFYAAGAPKVSELDAATGSVPTVLISADLHSAWLNSAAANAYGVTPVNGLLLEEDWFELMPHISNEPEALVDAWVEDAARAAAARGVVGVTDFEFGDTLTAWARRGRSGFSTLRINAAVWPDHLDAAIAAGLRTGDPLAFGGAGVRAPARFDRRTSRAASLIRMGPLKIISDGSLNTRTAWCHSPYPDGTYGSANLTDAELRSLMARAHQAGIHSAIHAIGDQANTSALAAFEATGAHGSIEHAQFLSTQDLKRFARLGVVASVQPAHLLDDRDVAEELWAGQTHRAYPFASLLAAGATLRFGSDAPVAPLDPWLAISAAITRSTEGRPAWQPQEALSPAAALRASVARPTLQVGDPADFIVLDQNPLDLPASELQNPGIQRTICAGQVTYEA